MPAAARTSQRLRRSEFTDGGARLVMLASNARRHQRKKTFVKRYGKMVALIVVILVAWGFLLRVMPVSARWRGQAI